ncbi:MAG: hypothetical protein QXU46_03550 [Candidatus Bathyarchaeia archaeon]
MIDPDHAYIIGCLIAGGRIGQNRVSIKFPFKKWGKISEDPHRASENFKSIVMHVQPKLRELYGLDSYTVMEPEWQLVCEGDITKLLKDLSSYGIKPQGILREHASIRDLTSKMDLVCKRDFVAAMADVIGSVTPSHRRFDMSHTIVSFEILGENFHLVMELCHLLRELGCPVDQILWEHPNMHCGYDPWDDEWINKGNKLRVLTWDFVRKASFVFGSKIVAAERNLEKERRELTAQVRNRLQIRDIRNEFCPRKRIQIKGIKTVHNHEFHERLLPEVRGHFIHYTHICAAMGCPFAPKKQLKSRLKKVQQGYLFNPFVVYKFGNYHEIKQLINSESIMAQRKYKSIKVPVKKLITLKDNSLIFKKTKDVGYPAGFVKEAINQIVKANLGIPRRKKLNNESNRTRTLKLILLKYQKILESINILIPELPTPLIVTDNKWAALIGPENPQVYKRLVGPIDFSNFRGIIITPIREEHLCLNARLF